MKSSKSQLLANIALSHFEIYVDDLPLMLDFYTQCLGLVITNKEETPDGMVFRSNSPQEHHQLVLNPGKSKAKINSPMDHIAFRVDSMTSLRSFHETLKNHSAKLQTVSHGTTWSIYFSDPEKNRFEIFTDTPWHITQPCRFDVDFNLSDEELFQYTKKKIEHLPGFSMVNEWRDSHVRIFDKQPD